MWTVEPNDIDDIALGAAVLGAGGGGDPTVGILLAKARLALAKEVSIVSLDEVPDDAVVACVAGIGAPMVMQEKLPTAGEGRKALTAMGEVLGKEVTHIACAEIGGFNSLMPIVAAAEMGLPLIDADFMGRAFPELQMAMPTLYGVTAYPVALVDEKGNSCVISAVDNHWTETLVRTVTVAMGSSSVGSLYSMPGSVAKEAMVPDTISLSRELGQIMKQARREHRSVSEAICDRLEGKKLFTGKVVDVERRSDDGFTRGVYTVEALGSGAAERIEIATQNEHLMVTKEGVPLATVPDLIAILDLHSGEAVTGEAVRYGQRVEVIVLPCDPRWHSPAGIELVGPRYFGYDTDPIPVKEVTW
jgi:DUF917 family protein